MAKFEGYLFGAFDLDDDGELTNRVTAFPNEYINYDAYDTIPNSREEIKAYRDDNTRNLTRVTAVGHKSSFNIKTRKNLHVRDMKKIMQFFQYRYTHSIQRKFKARYWNMAEFDYKDTYMYVADINYSVKKITANDIIFNEVEISLVEY